MRKLTPVWIFLLCLAAAPAVPRAPAKAPTTQYVDFKERWLTPPKKPSPLLAHKSYHSQRMDTEVGYHIYLPHGYDAPENRDKRYPVIYWCHGLNQSESSDWFPPAVLHEAQTSGAVPPLIVVYLSGGSRTFYSDSADGKILSETTIIKELIPHIDQTYRTVAAREGRAIQGMSMGGWGALRLAMAYPDLFSSVVAFAPSLRTPENIAERYPDVVDRMFGGDLQKFWTAHPLNLARKHADVLRQKLAIAFYCGTKDHLLEGSRNLHALLDELKLPHSYREVDGAVHNLNQLVGETRDSTLKFAVEHFRSPQR